MKQSRRDTDAFDDELQGKLSQLSQRRSQKKIRIKPLLENYQQQNKKYFDDCVKILSYNNNNQKYFNTKNYSELDNGRNKGFEQEAIKYRKDKKIILQTQQNANENSNQKSKHSQIQTNNVFSSISNKQLAEFLSKNMPQSDNLDLSFFLAKCLTQFSEQNQLTQQQIKMIFLQLQQQITTTDPNLISLNALELAVKKKSNSIQLYIEEKIARSKIQVQHNKIKQKEKKVQRSMHQYHQIKQQLDTKQKQLAQMENSIKQREKQIAKKQKAYSNKQKQLMERIKGHKKMLEQRAHKLSEAYFAQLNVVFEKIEKKINTYERNMKYRVESLNQKMNQIHRLRQYKQSDIKNSAVKQAQEKYEKLNASKNKKYENQIKQLNNKCQILRKQLKQSQVENNKLMKICSKLQNKAGKQQARLKQLLIQIDNKNTEIKQLKYIYSLKQKQNQQLMSKLCSQNDSNLHLQQGEQSFDRKFSKNDKVKTNTNSNKQKQLKLGVSKSKRSITNKNKLQTHNNTDKKSKIQEQIDIAQIVQGYQLILSIICIKSQNCQNILATGGCKALIQLCTKLFVKGLYCNSLTKFIVSQIVDAICENSNQSKDNKQNISKIKSIFNELQSYECRQNVDTLQKYMKVNNSKKTTKLSNQQYHKYNSCLYKLQIIYCLISNAKQAQFWLNEINQMKQLADIEQQMHAMVHDQGSKQQYNFVIAIVIKLFTQKHQPNMDILQQCSDLILRLRLVGQPKCNEYWQSSLNLGYLLIKDFISIAKIVLQNEQYFNRYSEQIERVSILIQRLVVGHNIGIKHDSYECFDRLRTKCKGSLLQMNMNSILQAYESHNKDILRELDQICDD